jgi:hypothetical protein
MAIALIPYLHIPTITADTKFSSCQYRTNVWTSSNFMEQSPFQGSSRQSGSEKIYKSLLLYDILSQMIQSTSSHRFFKMHFNIVAYLLRLLLSDGSITNLNRETVFYKVRVANVAMQRRGNTSLRQLVDMQQ